MPALQGRIGHEAPLLELRFLGWLAGWIMSVLCTLPLAAQDTHAAAADPDDQVSRGVVIGHDGQPVANVEVWLTRTDWWAVGVEVLDNTRTDGAGRFRVKVPGRWFQAPVGSRHELGFIARGADGGLAALAFDQYSPIPAAGIQLDLPKPSQTAIRILSPDKQPVAGARVVIESAGGPQVAMNVPEEQVQEYPDAVRTPNGVSTKHATIALPAALQKIFTGTTADDGTVVFQGIAPDQVRAVSVTTAKYGVQFINYVKEKPPQPRSGWPAEIELSATGTLRGKLTANKPDWLKGRRLVINSFDEGADPGNMTRTGGRAEVTTDAAGRFEIAALAPGTLRISSPADAKLGSCISAPHDFKIAAGESREIELPVVPLVRIRGLVQELGGSKPIANLDLKVSIFVDVLFARTDGRGAYEVDVPGGQVWATPLLPVSLMPASDNDPNELQFPNAGHFFVPEGLAEFQAPPLKLRRAATIRGVVLDDTQKPVPGATVAASWFGYSRRNSRPASQDETMLTNERGEFVLDGVDFRSELLLRAHTGAACTAKATALGTAPAKPVSLNVSPNNMARLKGRVVDSKGQPVADVRLELWSRGRRSVPRGQRAVDQPGSARRIVFYDGDMLRTDARGEFVSPPLESDQQYRVELRARGFRETTGDWVPLAAGKTVEIAELAVRRITEARGVVRDIKGQPVAKAAVTFAEPARRVETVTDENGEFRLGDIADGESFLFVRKEGWRFHGERYAANGAGPVKIILETPDVAPSAAFTVVGRPGQLADRRARAVKLLEQALDAKAGNENDREQNRVRTLEAWARIDPAAALARLESRPFKDPDFADMIRHAAVQRLASRDADAALEIVETMSRGYARALSLVEVGDSLPASERQRQLDLLADALVLFRAVKEPEMRLCGIALVAERLLDLGEQKRGEKLFRDDFDTARQLGTAAFGGFARGMFAEKFGVVDLPAALDLLKGLQDTDEFDRHHGNLAHELAGKIPADAEKVLNLIKPPEDGQFNQRDSYAVRVCYRMASVDLPRAERIALSIVDVSQRGYALGVMAEALATKDVKKARDLLRRAYDVLDEGDRDWKSGVGPHHPAIIAGCLLATARKLAADAERLPLLKECIWRAIALVPPATTDPNKKWYAVEAGSSVALWLAEFDAPLAREVLMRVDGRQGVSSRTYAPALALVAGDRLDEFLEGIPEDSRNSKRMSAAAILPLEGAELRRQIHRDTGVWPIDVEDIDW
ncbi:MAG TPA: carboxypeptidase-like regulatory domain-containing protein [Planctomycetaceae bacterium]